MKKFKLHQLSDEELKELHDCLIEMYEDVLTFCNKHKIQILMGGGSVLGTFRHHGFIPWDDDLDLQMLRSDFDVFFKYFDKELGGKYYIYAPNTKYGSRTCFPRLIRKDTTLIDIRGLTGSYHTGIWIDINLLEYVPENKLIRTVKGLRCDIVRVIAASVHWYTNRNKYVDTYYSHSKSYNIKLLMGKLFSFRKYQSWYDEFDKISRYNKVTSIITCPSGRKYYLGECRRAKSWLPPVEMKFEGKLAYVPHSVKSYLRSMYGDDYMQLPPAEKRENHSVVYMSTKEEVRYPEVLDLI